MEKKKKIQSKTLWFNSVYMCVVGFLNPDLVKEILSVVMEHASEIKDFNVKYYIALSIINGLFNIYLRFKTNKGI